MDPASEIKDRLGVEEVVGGYIQLKPAGRNLKGLCPFHHEKTPSFTVSPEKGIYHCFGCGEGGDIFTFVQKMDGLDFRQALELLARRAGVELPEGSRPDGNKELKERLYQALEMAAQYYHITLGKDGRAKEYVQGTRGYGVDVIRDFKIGFAPSSGMALTNFLKAKGFSEQEIVKAGLGRQSGSKAQDMFRGRIMVPFFDISGRVIGFTGRVLDDGLPKYLNTPQTLLFDKSRFVFGLYQAKEAIRTQDVAVVVEGNLDVLSAHQAGSHNTVAVSGTALTLPQLKSLGRLSKNIILAFDQDAAGLKATERAIPLAQEAGVIISIATLPEGADPDDLIRQDPKEWQRVLESAQYVMDWLLATLAARYELTNALGKKQFTNRWAETLTLLKDPVEQAHYIQKIAQMVGFKPEVIKQRLEMTNKPKPSPTRIEPKQFQPTKRSDSTTVEEALLALVLLYPDARASLDELAAQHFSDDARQVIFEYLKTHKKPITDDTIPKSLQSHSTYVKILLLKGEEEYDTWSALDRQVESFSLANRLTILETKKQKQILSQQIKAAEVAGDHALRDKLLADYNNLLHRGD